LRLTSAGRALYEFVAPFIEGLKGGEAAISTRVAVHRLRIKGSVFPVHAAWRTSLPVDPLIEATLAALPDQARGTSSSS
jgi:hypothetical protein